jgi:hypothetical protein
MMLAALCSPFQIKMNIHFLKMECRRSGLAMVWKKEKIEKGMKGPAAHI